MWLIDDVTFLQVDPKNPDRKGLKKRLKSAQKELQRASRDKTLTLVIGNGVSLNAVYEARHLSAAPRNSSKAQSWGDVVKKQFTEHYRHASRASTLLIMAQAIASVARGREDLLRAIEAGTKNTPPCHLHRMIAKLKPRYIVTTNYDLLLENKLYDWRCYVRHRRNSASFKNSQTTIIKMHGSFAPDKTINVAALYPGFDCANADKSIVISETDYDKCNSELIREKKKSQPLWKALTKTLLIVGKSVLWEDLSFMWALRQLAEMMSKGTECGPAWWLVENSISDDQELTIRNLDIVPVQMQFPVQKASNGAHHYFANVKAFEILFGRLLEKTTLEQDAAIDQNKRKSAYNRLVRPPDVVAIGLTALNTMGCPDTRERPAARKYWFGRTPLPSKAGRIYHSVESRSTREDLRSRHLVFAQH